MSFFQNLSSRIHTTDRQDQYDAFLSDIEREHHHLLFYFEEIHNLIITKKTEIETEFKNEDIDIKHSLLQEPRYTLYKNKFEDIFYKSSLLTLISNFENSLSDIINILTQNKNNLRFNNKVIINKLKIIHQEINMNHPDSINPNEIQFYIHIRNSIVHDNSVINDKIKSHDLFMLYQDSFILKGEIFYFNDMKIILHLLNLLEKYYYSFKPFIK